LTSAGRFHAAFGAIDVIKRRAKPLPLDHHEADPISDFN
jgi:hypothetical protein